MGQPKGVILGLPSLGSPPRVSPFAVYSELTKMLAGQISARCVKSDQWTRLTLDGTQEAFIWTVPHQRLVPVC